MENDTVLIHLDQHYSSIALKNKYKRETQLINLIKQCTFYINLIDDLPFLLQSLRLLFSNNYPNYIVENSIHLPTRWKQYREVALLFARHSLFNHHFSDDDDYERFLLDKEIMMEVLIHEGLIYSNKFPLGLDREFMLKACKVNGNFLKFATQLVNLQDRELVLEAVRSNGNALAHVVGKLKEDYTIIYEAIKQGNFKLDHFPPELFENNRKLVLAAMEHQPETYFKIPQESPLKNDPKVLQMALSKKIPILNRAPPSCQSNRDFVMKSVKNFGSELEYAHPSFRKDREIVLESVKTCGKCLRLVSDVLKMDREIVLLAVQQCGIMLEYAHESLRNDMEIVLQALKNDGHAIRYASKELKLDLNISIEALKGLASITQIHSSLQTDKRILLEFLSQKRMYEFDMSDDEFPLERIEIIRRDRELLSKGVLKWGSLLNPLPSIVDRDFMIEALRNGLQSKFVPNQFTKDANVMFEMFSNDFHSFLLIEEPLLSDREFILKCVKKSGHIFSKIHSFFQFDREIILEAIKQGCSLSEIDPIFRSDREIVIECVKKTPYSIAYADPRFVSDADFIVEIVKCSPAEISDFLLYARDSIMNNQELFLKVMKISPAIANYLAPSREWMELALQQQLEKE